MESRSDVASANHPIGTVLKGKDGRSIEARKRATQRFQERWRNDPDYKARHQAAGRRFRANNPDYDCQIHVRFDALRAKAKFREYPVSLNLEQYKGLIIGKPCHYCGVIPGRSTGSGLDRVDSSKGYSIDNCVPCCYLCNVMKSDLPLEQFYVQIERILVHRR